MGRTRGALQWYRAQTAAADFGSVGLFLRWLHVSPQGKRLDRLAMGGLFPHLAGSAGCKYPQFRGRVMRGCGRGGRRYRCAPGGLVRP